MRKRPNRARRRVLIAEDDAQSAAAMASALRGEGFAVQVVCHGADAVHELIHAHYEVAVLDLMMPRLSGVEVIAAVRRSSPGTKYIVLSAQADALAAADGMPAVPDAYLGKPVAIADLVSLVLRLAGGR